MEIDLGGRQLIFNKHFGAFCLRHDVDGCLWQIDESTGELNHTDTYSALGYVQASKQSRKFTVACSNYSAIVDRTRHIYIYRQPGVIETDLRNRKSGQKIKAVAKQNVVTLDSTTDEILGALALPNYLLINTSSTLSCIKL